MVDARLKKCDGSIKKGGCSIKKEGGFYELGLGGVKGGPPRKRKKYAPPS